MTNLTDEQIVQINQKVVELHNILESHIGSIYDLWIREASNSRRTNLKRLNKWKLIEVKPLKSYSNLLSFFIKIESPKGKHKSLFADEVIKYILRG